MAGFRLHDWNDARVLLACAEHGSFAAAAIALGLDQSTVSRRITLLEQAAGRPLFHRRRSGASPTTAGHALVERARMALAAVGDFEATLEAMAEMAPTMVTIGASEGLLSYTLIPVLLGNSATPQPLDSSLIRKPLPNLAFTTHLARADIAIVATAQGDIPPVKGAMRVRRVGNMHFAPVAGRALLDSQTDAITSFADLAAHPLLDIAIYRPIRSLDHWNEMVADNDDDRVILTPNSRTMHQFLVEGRGVGILPSYSSLYDDRIVVLDLALPRLEISLWLVAHEDKLREPAVRDLYDTLADIFPKSPWFR